MASAVRMQAVGPTSERRWSWLYTSGDRIFAFASMTNATLLEIAQRRGVLLVLPV